MLEPPFASIEEHELSRTSDAGGLEELGEAPGLVSSFWADLRG